MSEIWEADGKYVFRGKDCIGIFDTDNAADPLMEERARVAAAAPDLLAALTSLLPHMRWATDCDPAINEQMERDVDKARAAITKATGGA